MINGFSFTRPSNNASEAPVQVQATSEPQAPQDAQLLQESPAAGPEKLVSTQWRILISKYVAWRPAIHEILFLDEYCSELKIVPTQMISSGSSGRLTSEAVAADGSFETMWRPNSETCEASKCWLGALFPEPVGVQCVRLYQSQQHNQHITEVALQRFVADTWQTVEVFDKLKHSEWVTLRTGIKDQS